MDILQARESVRLLHTEHQKLFAMERANNPARRRHSDVPLYEKHEFREVKTLTEMAHYSEVLGRDIQLFKEQIRYAAELRAREEDKWRATYGLNKFTWNFAHVFSLGSLVLMILFTCFSVFTCNKLDEGGGYFAYVSSAIAWLTAAMWVGTIYMICYMQQFRKEPEAKF